MGFGNALESFLWGLKRGLSGEALRLQINFGRDEASDGSN